MKILLVICGWSIMMVAFLGLIIGSPKEKEESFVQGKITIRLSSGEKLYPSRAHVHPEHVQVIMPDGTAITMAWKQVDSISNH